MTEEKVKLESKRKDNTHVKIDDKWVEVEEKVIDFVKTATTGAMYTIRKNPNGKIGFLQKIRDQPVEASASNDMSNKDIKKMEVEDIDDSMNKIDFWVMWKKAYDKTLVEYGKTDAGFDFDAALVVNFDKTKDITEKMMKKHNVRHN